MQEASPRPDLHHQPSQNGSSKLRIGMICPYSLTVPGGVQQQVMGLARELRRMGYETRVLGPCDGPPPASFVSPLGNSLPTPGNGSMAPIAPDVSAQFRTIRLLNDENFDVLHVHEPLVPGPTETALFLHPAPIVATYHAAGLSSGYRWLRPPLKRLTDHISRSVVVSKDALALIQGHMGGEYEVLFNGVELDRFQQAAPQPDMGRFVFFCGRHEERKGLGVLLATVDQLPDDVRVVIGGEGPDTKRLRQQFQNPRIEWLGLISDEVKIAHLRAASVFCAPSLRGESFGVVLIEAMAAGTPVVASALDGYKNVVTDSEDALLCKPGDVDSFAAALNRVLDDPELAQRLRDAGCRRAEDFSMTSLARAYASIYEDLAAEARAHPESLPESVPRWRADARRMMLRVRGG